MTDKSNNIISKLLGKESVIQPLIVCQQRTEENSLSSITEALQKVVKGGVIKLMPGVYRQNIIIKQGDIKIQAFNPNSNVIIINSSHPSVIIHLQNDKQAVSFQSIKFAHHCNINPDLIQNDVDSIYLNDQINCFKIGQALNTIMYIRRGKVIIQECKFSLNVINPENRSIIPCITIQKQGFLIMTRCELFGSTNFSKQTIGILSKKGSAVIKECQFIAHQKAAVYFSGYNDTIFTLANSKIHHCSNGIVLIGDFKSNIENNSITDCTNIGIKVGMCNKSKINSNLILHNKLGIYFQNADPMIQNNTINFSKTEGILCVAKDMIKCNGEIKFNEIKQSKLNGIRCSGNLNEVKICNNQQIVFNGKCGVMVENGAHPFIFKNKIDRNLGQGILITEGSSAFIEKNQILNNLKSNISLGGKHSINTTILNNKILSSRSQGIFMIYGERMLISGNIISKNHDGIIGISSIPVIENNEIVENESNGILMLNECNVEIFQNKIQENKDAGLFLKNGSRGTVSKNQFKGNKYELIIDTSHPSIGNVDVENSFEGEVRIPQNYKCSLI